MFSDGNLLQFINHKKSAAR